MWAAIIIWLYSNVKVAEFSWYEDVILDTCCQNIASSDEIWDPIVKHKVFKGISWACLEARLRARQGQNTLRHKK